MRISKLIYNKRSSLQFKRCVDPEILSPFFHWNCIIYKTIGYMNERPTFNLKVCGRIHWAIVAKKIVITMYIFYTFYENLQVIMLWLGEWRYTLKTLPGLNRILSITGWKQKRNARQFQPAGNYCRVLKPGYGQSLRAQ